MPKTPFFPVFIDGEGCSFPYFEKLERENRSSISVPEHRYVYLGMTDKNAKHISIQSETGFSTEEIFTWIFEQLDLLPDGSSLVGFALGYDWEFWLRDIPNEAYYALRKNSQLTLPTRETLHTPSGSWSYDIKQKKDGTRYIAGILWTPFHSEFIYRVRMIPGKVLRIGRKRPHQKRFHEFQCFDTFGFFQTSFILACEDWDVSIPKAVLEGKAARGTFTWADFLDGTVPHYAEEEGYRGALLIDKFWKSLQQGFKKAGLKEMHIKKTHLYGPGAIAGEFFTTYLVDKDWPVFKINPDEMIETHWQNLDDLMDLRYYQKITQDLRDKSGPDRAQQLPSKKSQDFYDSMYFPFLWSYYGGRIESAAMGFTSKAFDADLNSAYVAAATRLPRLTGTPEFCKSPEEILQAIDSRLVGMYHVSWSFPDGWDWYPFPYRNRLGMICFPRIGDAWVLSPEVYAAWDTVNHNFLHINRALVYLNTEGLGGAEKPLERERMSRAGIKLQQQIDVRLDLKAKGDPAAKPLKLIPLSFYGKAIQQIGRTLGDLGTFNPLLASWCTSFTRSQIWRAIAPHKDDQTIISVQTDGILSRTPLSLNFSSHLGDWTIEEATNVYQLLPGIYQFTNSKGKLITKQRGIGSRLPFEELRAHFASTDVPYVQDYTTFVTRLMAITQKKKLGHLGLRWVPLEKHVSLDLSTKRLVPPGLTIPEDSLSWFPPVDLGATLLSGAMPGLPYCPRFQDGLTDDFLEVLASLEGDAEGTPEFFGE